MNDTPEIGPNILARTSPAAKNAGIGPQSCREEIKPLAGTGLSLATKTKTTPPPLGHNHIDEWPNSCGVGTFSIPRHFTETFFMHSLARTKKQSSVKYATHM